MPNYRIIVQETKSYFLEADNRADAAHQLSEWEDAALEYRTPYQSWTVDRFDIDEVEHDN